MLEFITNRGDIRSELYELIRCFVSDTEEPLQINFTYIRNDDIILYVAVNEKGYRYTYATSTFGDKTEYTRYDLYVNKHGLYRALSEYFGRHLPWGSLTGIRPTRLASRLVKTGVPMQNVASHLASAYLVSPEKAQITAEILRTQSQHIEDRLSVASGAVSVPQKELVNLYIHIPFCPTRCDYCSFVSQGIEKQRWLLSPYADALVREIRFTKALIEKQGKRIFSIYIGGGTPTVLDAPLLQKILSAAYEPNVEYTCEAGRPDTIDEEKLQVINSCGVNRISINPQTLHDATLLAIGRKHTAAQFFQAYASAAQYGFVKNVDLIAGLENETPADFRYSLDRITELQPENITVHTLCRKRGSQNALEEKKSNEYTEEMVDYSVRALKHNGYTPYYLYRQKQMTANLENIGWCKSGFLCVNNVTVMEELLPVYACGAGAISKLIPDDGRIVRLANPKDILLYLDQFDERMKKKELFYKNQFTLIS